VFSSVNQQLIHPESGPLHSPEPESSSVEHSGSAPAAPPAASPALPKVGRNDVCPCGSGKKYKKCCGA
jgi:uncharacterized protein YecA (UPF0149 family)